MIDNVKSVSVSLPVLPVKWGAAVTPHVFVVDSDGQVVYRGYVDDSAKPAERRNEALKQTLDSVLRDQPVANDSTKAFGCTIK